VTGGGSITGKFGVVFGVIDRSGSHPALAPCAQAIADAPMASAALAVLQPARSFDRIIVKKDESVVLDAGDQSLTAQAHRKKVRRGCNAKQQDC
jgi:hypothetical protein